MQFFNVTSVCSNGEYNGECYHRQPIGIFLACLSTLIIAVTAITGNSAVLIVTFFNDSLRRHPGNFLIVYLSCVDINTAVSVMIPTAIAVAADRWPLGEAMCKYQFYSACFGLCSSTSNLAGIGIDRALAVTLPFKYQNLMSNKIVIYVCSFFFVFATFIGAINIPFYKIVYDYQMGWCYGEFLDNPMFYYLYHGSSFACFYLPSAILAVCYVTIIITAKKSNNSVQQLFVRRGPGNVSLRDAMPNKATMMKTIKSLVIVAFCFYLCFAPNLLMSHYRIIFDADVPPWMNFVVIQCIFLSSATNPFIYGIFRKDYRDAFKRQFKIIFR